MHQTYKTERLQLHKLTLHDVDFIFELVNTGAWIKFIGDRQVKTTADAIAYIEKITANPDVNYWVVKLKDSIVPLGVITFIKRNYLEQHDIGFAFLPQHAKKGYAFEAAQEVLNNLLGAENCTTILATTIKENIASIQLLKKLGFTFKTELNIGNETLHVYAVNKDQLCKPINQS